MRAKEVVRKLFRAAGRRPGCHAVVLMYHRIAQCEIDPWSMCVPPRRFAEHLEALKGSYRVGSVSELMRADAATPKTVAITFDDGYADNLYHGAPLLERHEVPASFFLASGTLDSQREFWWDELEALLLRPPALPESIRVSLGNDHRVLQPGRAGEAAPHLPRQVRAIRPWKAAPNTRLGFYYEVWRLLRPLEETARRRVLEEISFQVEPWAMPRSSHRALTAEEARTLAGVPGVEIGAHSVTHALLSAQSPALQHWEMHQSKRDLEQLLGRRVAGFAYPYGEYGPEAPALARAVGFEFACTTQAGGISAGVDRYELPRIAVEDCAGAHLLRRLERLLG